VTENKKGIKDTSLHPMKKSELPYCPIFGPLILLNGLFNNDNSSGTRPDTIFGYFQTIFLK